MITVIPKTSKAERFIEKMKLGFTAEGLDRVIEGVAQKTHAALVQATPKKWTGQTRRSWRVIKQPGGYRVTNLSKVMLFLEEGTKDHGPVEKKFLFIPLNRKAAIGGWNPGLVIGVDYILRKRVRGITAMHIVEAQRQKTKVLLVSDMVAYIRGLIS